MRRRPLTLAAAFAAVLLAGAAAVALTRPAGPPEPSSSVGVPMDRALPDFPLIGSDGRPTSLAAYRGKVVVLSDFLTSCQEVCPITTGALEQVQAAIGRAGLAGKAVILDVTIDPGRDTPSRLRAYARYTGADFALATGTPAELSRLWSFLGVEVQRAPEPKPPGRDWQTGRPYAYDVAHEDGLFFLDRSGRERFVMVGGATLQGPLSQRLTGLLDTQGHQLLAQPDPTNWTVPQALSAVAWLTGRPIPGA